MKGGDNESYSDPDVASKLIQTPKQKVKRRDFPMAS